MGFKLNRRQDLTFLANIKTKGFAFEPFVIRQITEYEVRSGRPRLASIIGYFRPGDVVFWMNYNNNSKLINLSRPSVFMVDNDDSAMNYAFRLLVDPLTEGEILWTQD